MENSVFFSVEQQNTYGHSHYTSKLIQNAWFDLNVNFQKRNLCYLDFGKEFLKTAQKTQPERKTCWLDFIKIKYFFCFQGGE